MSRALARIRHAVRLLWSRRAADRDLDDEMAAAVDILAARAAEEGLAPDEAQRRARAAFGSRAAVREATREVRPGVALAAFVLDLRYAVRGLRKAPGLAAVIVVTLALGIGATAAIFSVVHTLLLAPLPYRDADRLIFVWSDMTSAGYPRAPLSGPELADLRHRSITCSGFGAIWANTVALTGEHSPEQLRIGIVTDNFFEILGASPALGRGFQPQDAVPGAHPAILLGWALFERRYGGDPAIVGRQILVNDRPTSVIGVMPKAFRLLLPPDASVPDDLQAWTPFGAGVERGPRGQQFLRVVGRMKPGVAVATARDEIAAIARRISSEFPEYAGDARMFTTVALQRDDVRELRPALLALFAGIGILLIIACVNVASLLIARAVARTKEMALRLALGASRGRLLRQCLAEGLVLAALGAAGGAATGIVLLNALVALRPVSLSRIDLSRFDPAVAAFIFAVALLWGLLFSLAPMLEIFKADLAVTLQRQGRGAGVPLRYRARAVLVGVQLALCVVLLVGASLLARAFVRLQGVDPGFRSDHVLTFRVSVPFQRFRAAAPYNAFARQMQQALGAIPGVTAVGAISHLPYDDLPNWGGGYAPPGAAPNAAATNADYRTATPGLFEAMGIPLLDGRTFTEEDQAARGSVIVVDERIARRLWPGRSALGQQLLVDPGSNGSPTVKATVVGVTPHLRLRSLVADLTDQIFFPERAVLRNPMAYVIRADRDPAGLAADVRTTIATIDPRLPIYDVRPLDDYIVNARAMRRFTMQLALAFALAALALGCVGVYGVLAYSTARRRHEFGVRLALGAEPRRLVGTVVREGLVMVAAGVAAGLAVSVAVSQLLAGQLYGVQPRDPVSYGVPLALLGMAAVLACWLPARRALASSPMDALRAD